MASMVGLDNTRLGVIIVYTGIGLPIGVYRCTEFIRSIPDSVIESARVDGASYVHILWRIVLPMAKPVVTTLAIITIPSIWNEFILINILVSSNALRSLSVGILRFSGALATEYGKQFAGLVIGREHGSPSHAACRRADLRGRQRLLPRLPPPQEQPRRCHPHQQGANVTLAHGLEPPGTVHWDPDCYAPPKPWSHISDWDPPSHRVEDAGPLAAVVSAWGPMPFGVDEVEASVTYTFFAGLPYFRAATMLRVGKPVAVQALRMGEMVFNKESVDHFAWRDLCGDIHELASPLLVRVHLDTDPRVPDKWVPPVLGQPFEELPPEQIFRPADAGSDS